MQISVRLRGTGRGLGVDSAATGLRQFAETGQIRPSVHHDLLDVSQVLLHLHVHLDWLFTGFSHAVDGERGLRNGVDIHPENGGHANRRVQLREPLLSRRRTRARNEYGQSDLYHLCLRRSYLRDEHSGQRERIRFSWDEDLSFRSA